MAAPLVLTDAHIADIRLECLRRAGDVDVARKWADFVLGTGDAEIIAAARELAEKVSQPPDDYRIVLPQAE